MGQNREGFVARVQADQRKDFQEITSEGKVGREFGNFAISYSPSYATLRTLA